MSDYESGEEDYASYYHSNDSAEKISDDDKQSNRSSDSSDVEDESDDSDCDSELSMYHLTSSKVSFVSLNIMILMEYAEGETLRDLIDNHPSYLSRNMVFNLFTQLMTALKQIHS